MKIFTYLFALFLPLVLVGQQNGSISATMGYHNFIDHQIHGAGLSISYQTPYLFKKEKWFIEVSNTFSLGEGNRNFEYDPSKNYSLMNPNHQGNILSENRGRWFAESGSEMKLKTSKSIQKSFEAIAAKAYSFKNEKHRMVVGLGVYYGIITQHYLLDNIDMVVEIPPHVGDEDLELQYNVPFMQKYRLWSMVGSVQYHYQIGQQLYLKSDLRYYYQKAPFVGSLFLGFGVGVNI